MLAGEGTHRLTLMRHWLTAGVSPCSASRSFCPGGFRETAGNREEGQKDRKPPETAGLGC